MPDRIIRDELLTSERYWSVTDRARLLHFHLLLCADDTARYSGNNFSLRAKCFPGQNISAEEMESLLKELTDADLIRPYRSDSERFLFIPRFRQRLRYTNSKFPVPPSDISDLASGKSDSSQPQDKRKNESSRSQVSRSEEKGGEVLHTSALRFEEFWSAYPSCKRKESKQECLKIWKTRKLHRIAEQIICHVKAKSVTDDWRKQDGQFIPAPLTYLRRESWEGAELGGDSTQSPSTDALRVIV